MINTKFLTLTLESNGEVLELGKSEYKLLEVHGLEASDYDINITEHYSGIGGYVKKKKIQPREREQPLFLSRFQPKRDRLDHEAPLRPVCHRNQIRHDLPRGFREGTQTDGRLD